MPTQRREVIGQISLSGLNHRGSGMEPAALEGTMHLGDTLMNLGGPGMFVSTTISNVKQSLLKFCFLI